MKEPRSAARYAGKQAFTVLLMGLVLYASSGDAAWIEGQLFTVFLLVTQGAGLLILYRVNPDLLVERSSYGEGTQRWDWILMPLMALAGPFSVLIVTGLDHRYAWTQGAPLPYLPSLLLGAVGHFTTVYAMAENRFFATTVRVQGERGHKVVSSGPYAVVRHPGYLGAVLWVLAVPGLLGSGAALLPAAATVAVTIIRTWKEDRFLGENLAGYAEYASRVKQRLFPLLW
jgi:protein-S-isoprenylcysteine O-methyltransferase Ste14